MYDFFKKEKKESLKTNFIHAHAHRCQCKEWQGWRLVCGRCWKDVSGGVPDGDALHRSRLLIPDLFCLFYSTRLLV